MRTSLKKPKPKTPTTLLQQQSSKLKEKLQLLRNQVTQKKQFKQMNKTATSMQIQNVKKLEEKFLPQEKYKKIMSPTMQEIKMSLSNNDDSWEKLKNVLSEFKLEGLEEKLKQKGIRSYERLVKLTEGEIDEWKDVPVGYRIKLKKNIRMLKEKIGVKEGENNINKAETTTPSTIKQIQSLNPTQLKTLSPRDIQSIIRQRKQQRTFIPLNRKIQPNQQEQEQQQNSQLYNNNEMPDEEQDVIIQSFMRVFQPRRGILHYNLVKKETNGSKVENNHKKRVNWSPIVQQMQEQFMRKNHKTYPKETIVKEALIHMHEEQLLENNNNNTFSKSQPKLRYCWKCFSKIDTNKVVLIKEEKVIQAKEGGRFFCSQKCLQAYSEQVSQGQQKEEQVQQKQLKECNQQRMNPQKLQKYESPLVVGQDDDIETIDLSIL